jgi:hypothetical protein
MCSSTADSHIVIAALAFVEPLSAMPVDSILFSFVRHWCSHGTAVHDASVNLARSISPCLPYHLLSLILDYPFVLAQRLLPASHSSLKVTMFTGCASNDLYDVLNTGSLYNSCKPAESFPPHVLQMVPRSESLALPF